MVNTNLILWIPIAFISIPVTFSMTSTMKFYYTKTLKTLFGDYKNVDTVDEFWNYMEGMAILVVEFQVQRT